MGGHTLTREIAYLGLGTNLGDRWANLREALRLLTQGPNTRVLRSSQVYETEPWGGVEQSRFLNCAAEFATDLDPEALLTLCKDVEERLGRVPGERWGPRLIDVDILLIGSQAVDLPHLEIPHPRLHVRAFALVPLAELCPDAVHPLLARSIGELARTADGRDGVRPVGDAGLSVAWPER